MVGTLLDELKRRARQVFVPAFPQQEGFCFIDVLLDFGFERFALSTEERIVVAFRW